MKRSDVGTRTVLRAVVEHGQIGGYVHLCETYPAKVVAAAFEREVVAGRLDYGVTLRSAWIEPAGRRWLVENPDPEDTK
jgi:hypothetical protein